METLSTNYYSRTANNYANDSAIELKRSTRRGNSFYYLFDYYPKNRFPELEGKNHSNRIDVWQFKDGNNTSKIARKVANALINEFGSNSLISKSFCVIPASTKAKTNSRFNDFCRIVCSQTGMENGYYDLTNSDDRGATHDSNERYIDHSSYLNIQDVYEKDIILFDDVVTSGRSMQNIKSTLLNEGANSVICISLAQTVSIYQ